MKKEKIYPNYRDIYSYNDGEIYIQLSRQTDTGLHPINTIYFDSPEEALEHFESNCGS